MNPLQPFADAANALPAWVTCLLVGLMVLGEDILFVGLIVPGEPALVAGGVAVATGAVDLPIMLAVGTLAAIASDVVSYALTRRYGAWLRGRDGRWIKREHWERAEGVLLRYGGKGVAVGRFIAMVRMIVPVLAATSGMPFRTFLLWSSVSGTVWASGYVMIGYIAGRAAGGPLGLLGYLSWALLAVLIASAVVRRVRRGRQRRRAERSTATPSPAWTGVVGDDRRPAE